MNTTTTAATGELFTMPDLHAMTVHHGDRIAQAMILPIPRIEFEVAEQLTLTDRGDGGFGSTGAA